MPPARPLRVAAIDLGTNSTRLLVADVGGDRLEEVARETRITRLGEGVDERRRLLPGPIARVRSCLAGYRGTLERLGAERGLAIATSAVRDAENGEAFLDEVERSYGLATRLLSGEQEALLTLRGVTLGRSLAPGTLILDVGGGSTELVVGGPDGVGFQTSLELGCVRLTERFLRSDPPAEAELVSCSRAVRSALAAGLPSSLRAASAIGVAGTVTTLAALDLGLVEYDHERVHGHVLSAASVEEQLDRLSALPLTERARVPGLEPDRAPVIVAGILIVREMLEHFALPSLEASERDILHGAALAAAELPDPVEGGLPPGAFTSR